jgi:plastocyanin
MFLVKVGGSLTNSAVQSDLYLPGTITIDEGDSIIWSAAPGADESHTVTFGTTGACGDVGKLGAASPASSYSGSGCVSSGMLWPAAAPTTAGPKTFALSFPKAGTYSYYCQFHKPAMVGTVVVQPAGTAYPAGETAYVAKNDPALAQAEKSGLTALAAQTVTKTANPDGSSTYTMNAGSGDGKTYSLYRFGADTLAIHAGDSVVWVQNDVADYHTVTFLDNGKDVPFNLPDGYPNPQAVSRTAATSYSGQGFVNSGLLVQASAPAAERTYRLTFPQPGTYSYECLIHDDAGMKGTIQVAAGQVPLQNAQQTLPGLPRTGGVPPIVLLGLGLLGVTCLGGGIRLARRSSRSERSGE